MAQKENTFPSYGIEILLKKAAVDPGFRELLLQNSEDAAAQIGLELDPAELGLIRTFPREQLATIIAQTEVPHSHRRAFLGSAAAAMLAALLSTNEAFAGGPPQQRGSSGGYGGVRADVPKNVPARETTSYGIRPDVPASIPPDIPVARRLPILLEQQFRVPRDKWKPSTTIRTDETSLPKLRQAIYKEFDVRMPVKTLKSLKTVKKLTEYIEDSLVGYEEEHERDATPPAEGAW